MSYKLSSLGGTIIRLADGAFIPPTTDNPDYRDYQAWVAAGNVAQAADPAPLVYTTHRALEGRVITNNATPTLLFNGTLAQNTGYVATLTVVGVDTGNGNVKSFVATVTCKRLGGNAILVGTPAFITPPQGDTGTEAWIVSGGVNGNDFRITVTGAAGRNVSWAVFGNFISFTPSGN